MIRPIYEHDFDREPTIETRPTSCQCGGDTAYVAVVGIRMVMLGCVCHHEPVCFRRHGHWHVSVWNKADIATAGSS